MLESRAAVPSWGPELLARTHYGLGSGMSGVNELPQLFEQWENWSADVSESHSTYPVLMAFRSPNPLASWITAQLAVLDAAALYLSLLGDPRGAISARLCLRGGFTCLRIVAARRGRFVVAEDPIDPDQGISLTYEEFAAVRRKAPRRRFPDQSPSGGRLARLRWLARQLRGCGLRHRLPRERTAGCCGPVPGTGPRYSIPPARPQTRRVAKK